MKFVKPYDTWKNVIKIQMHLYFTIGGKITKHNIFKRTNKFNFQDRIATLTLNKN